MIQISYTGIIWIIMIVFTLGAIVGYFDERRAQGVKGFGRYKRVLFDPDDPRISIGVQLGIEAGYFTATGEHKDIEELSELYLEALEKEEKKD